MRGRFVFRLWGAVAAALLALQPALLFAQDPNSLLETARRGDLEASRAALKRGASLEDRDPKGWTALMFASMRGYDELALLLIEAGADVNARAHDGSTPLIAAAVMGELGITRALLEGGADPLLENSAGATAQVKAKQYGHPEVALAIETAGRGGPKPARAAKPSDSKTAPSDTRTQPRDTDDEPAVPEQKPLARPEPQIDPLDVDFVLRDGANIRARPEGSSEKVGALPAGSTVRVLGKVRGRNWYRVGSWESSHYIWGDVLTPMTEAVLEPLPRPEIDEVRGSEAEEPEPDPVAPETPTPGTIEPTVAPASLLAQLNGRWTSWRNPSSCTRDFLEIEATAYSLNLRVHVAGEITPLASQVPVQSIEAAQLVAGSSDLKWKLVVEGNELRYAFGNGNEVLYFRCPTAALD